MLASARYEPILLALLKRRELTAGALVQAKEQAQELRAQLRPLKEEIQKLMLQRACLEEKLKLIHIQRREDMGQYKVSRASRRREGWRVGTVTKLLRCALPPGDCILP